MPTFEFGFIASPPEDSLEEHHRQVTMLNALHANAVHIRRRRTVRGFTGCDAVFVETTAIVEREAGLTETMALTTGTPVLLFAERAKENELSKDMRQYLSPFSNITALQYDTIPLLEQRYDNLRILVRQHLLRIAQEQTRSAHVAPVLAVSGLPKDIEQRLRGGRFNAS